MVARGAAAAVVAADIAAAQVEASGANAREAVGDGEASGVSAGQQRRDAAGVVVEGGHDVHGVGADAARQRVG